MYLAIYESVIFTASLHQQILHLQYILVNL